MGLFNVQVHIYWVTHQPISLFGHLKICVNFGALMMQELNIGGSIVVSALEEACGTNKSKIRDLYNSLGDLGMNK